MGQKVHPTGIRLGIVKDWTSKWYADSKTFPEYVRTDHELRAFIKNKLKDASVSRIAIERPAGKANITMAWQQDGYKNHGQGNQYNGSDKALLECVFIQFSYYPAGAQRLKNKGLLYAVAECRRHCIKRSTHQDTIIIAYGGFCRLAGSSHIGTGLNLHLTRLRADLLR